jgi:outer membrane receptor protein involved in Fe transport
MSCIEQHACSQLKSSVVQIPISGRVLANKRERFMKHINQLRFTPTLLASLIGLCFTTQSSYAQTPEADKQSNLEVITVTAQKRTQNQQEVPVAVTAFSGEVLAESVIKDVYDLQTNIPSLGAFQNQTATNSSFSIRGVGTSSQNFGLESSVGLYVDGVYRARQNSLINNLVDIESVQVLRGPQGTLFGKNTPSGAILVNTVAPSHDGGDSFIEATVGNFGLVNLSGATSFSAIDDILAFRVTAFSSDRDGTVSDINFGEDIINDRNRWGGRLQALYTPNDDISVRIIADYSEIDEICCAAPVVLGNASLSQGSTPGPNGLAVGQPGSDLLLVNAFGATPFTGEEFFDRRVATNHLPTSAMEDSGLSMEINWELSDHYSLASISAARSVDSVDFIDADFTDVDLITNFNDSQQSSFSQELRLDYKGDKLNYILGLYYFEQDLNLDYALRGGEAFGAFVNNVVLPRAIAAAGDGNGNGTSDLQDLLNGINGLSAATGGFIAPVAPAGEANPGFLHIAEQQHKSYAIFGQFDYQLNDKYTLTAGLRYTKEDKDLFSTFTEVNEQNERYAPFNVVLQGGQVAQAAANIGAALQSGQAPQTSDLATIAPLQSPGWGHSIIGAVTSSRPDINGNLPDNQFTGTLKLSYQPDKDSLYYGSIGTGYKSGGTNTDRIDAQFDPLFDAETSISFELGMKRDFPEHDLRVNAAIHKTDVSDFQANTFFGTGFNLQNAGDIETSGAEVDLTWLPTDTLEVTFSYAYLKAEFETFVAGNCWLASTFHNGLDDPGRAQPTDRFCNRSGDRLASQPEHAGVIQLKQDIAVSDSIYSFIQVDFRYTGDRIMDASNDPLHHVGSFSLFNLRYFMNFQEYDTDVIFWGRNIFDKGYIGANTFNTPIQDGKINAYLTEPATFGVTVKKRF